MSLTSIWRKGAMILSRYSWTGLSNNSAVVARISQSQQPQLGLGFIPAIKRTNTRSIVFDQNHAMTQARNLFCYTVSDSSRSWLDRSATKETVDCLHGNQKGIGYWFGIYNGGSYREKHSFKTNRSAYKRFRVRGNGTIVRGKAGRSHNTGYKTRGRCNRLGQTTTIKGKKAAKKIGQLIGITA